MAEDTIDTLLNKADLSNNIVNKYIVSPVFNLGLAGFIFDIPKETRIKLESDSTNHFAEDNTALQDHVALKPIEINTGGFVSELKYTIEDPKSEIQELTERLTTINAYIPALTTAARSTREAITASRADTISEDTLGKATNSAIDIYKAYKDINSPDTEQARAFNFFRALRDARQLVAIDTPWGFFNNLEIKSLTASQNSETKSITEFNMILKEFRTVKTQFVDAEFQEFTGRGLTQRSGQQDQGKAQGTQNDSSTLFEVKDSISRFLFGR